VAKSGVISTLAIPEMPSVLKREPCQRLPQMSDDVTTDPVSITVVRPELDERANCGAGYRYGTLSPMTAPS